MQTLILTLHISVCVLLVILVLLQSGKEGMGVIFGGGNSSVFGSSGAGGILAKLTAFMAVIFVITSLSYTIVTSERPETESAILSVKIEDSGRDAASSGQKSAQDGSPADSAGSTDPAGAPPANPQAPVKGVGTPAQDAAPEKDAEASAGSPAGVESGEASEAGGKN